MSIFVCSSGRKIVIIENILFQSRRGINWKKIEEHLKKYIGKDFEIKETLEKIYIGSDFPDEFSHSKDTKESKGANLKAKYGWYRYNTYFGMPVYDDMGNIERYNIFAVRMLVRRDQNGQLYLYDFVRTKKETSKPHEQ